MMGSTDEVQAGRSAHSCATCGRVATCVGRREGGAEQLACNGCCGHGGEDGQCRPVEGQGFYVLCLKERRTRPDLLWWKPARAGYTTSLEAAGVYTADEAYEICRSPDDCAAIPEATALYLRWAAVTDQIVEAMLAHRADRQDGAALTRADGPRASAGARTDGKPEHYRVGSGFSVVPHVDQWRLEMRSGEVVPVAVEPDRHRSIARARSHRVGGQSPYMATMQLAVFVSATDDQVAGILAPGVADMATILKAAKRFNPANVKADQVAKSGGAPASEE